MIWDGLNLKSHWDTAASLDAAGIRGFPLWLYLALHDVIFRELLGEPRVATLERAVAMHKVLYLHLVCGLAASGLCRR